MKVALVDDRYFSAYGAQRVMVSLAARLRDRGWEPTVITAGDGPLTGLARADDVPYRIVPIRPELELYGGEALRLPPPAKVRLLRSVLAYARDLDDAFADLDVDLVFANALRPLLYSVVARARRRRVLWFLQGGDQFGVLSLGAPFLPHRIMTVSHGAGAAIPGWLRPYAARRAFVNTPGVEPDRYGTRTRGGRRALGLPDDDTLVLVAGSVEHRKGFDVAVDALRLARRRVPGLHLVVAGSARGPENRAYERRLRAQAAAADVPVTFLGWVPDMATLMANVDIFVLCSRLERLGLVTLEAMATGLPVIVTRAGGSEEVVEDEVSGLVVEPETPADLARAVVRLCADPMLRDRIACAGRRRIRDHFTIEQFVDRFVADAAVHFPAGRARA